MWKLGNQFVDLKLEYCSDTIFVPYFLARVMQKRVLTSLTKWAASHQIKVLFLATQLFTEESIHKINTIYISGVRTSNIFNANTAITDYCGQKWHLSSTLMKLPENWASKIKSQKLEKTVLSNIINF